MVDDRRLHQADADAASRSQRSASTAAGKERSKQAPVVLERNDSVGTAAPGCPVEQSSTGFDFWFTHGVPGRRRSPQGNLRIKKRPRNPGARREFLRS